MKSSLQVDDFLFILDIVGYSSTSLPFSMTDFSLILSKTLATLTVSISSCWRAIDNFETGNKYSKCLHIDSIKHIFLHYFKISLDFHTRIATIGFVCYLMFNVMHTLWTKCSLAKIILWGKILSPSQNFIIFTNKCFPREDFRNFFLHSCGKIN